MDRPVSLNSKIRDVLAAWLVVAALAAHGLIPLGYMPDFSNRAAPHAGVMPLVICSGHGPMTMRPAQKPGSKLPPKSEASSICVFSLASLFTAAAPVFAGRLLAFAPVDITPADFLLAKDFYFGNAAPRAPPVRS